MSERFLVYVLVENTDTEHTVRFIGEIEAEPHEDAIERAVDGLIEERSQSMPRAAGDPDEGGWRLLSYEAALVFPVGALWQIDAPDRRGVKLGYGTSASRPRRMSVRRL